MKRASLLIGSLVATALTAAPAQAGKLTFWRFNEDNNRLVFQTEETVQPKAQLIFNPTRVVIDLPGTILGHSLVNQPVGGRIKEVRVGQFKERTTRLVVELAPGYTVNPEQVKIRRTTAKRWSVELPPPQRQTQRQVNPPEQTLGTKERNASANNSPLLETGRSQTGDLSERNHPDFQVTRSGLLLRLARSPQQDIEVERSDNKKRISFRLPGAQLPSNLPTILPVGKYGIGYAEFKASRNNSPPQVTLHVNEASPNWKALPTSWKDGGIVLLPSSGMAAVRENLPSPPLPQGLQDTANQSQPTGNQSQPTVVQAVDLVDNQLMVRANQPITGTGTWDPVSGVYEMKIPKAKLADPVQGPELTRNSPVSQIRVRQADPETVLVQIQSAPGVSILDRVNQLNENTLAVRLRQSQTASRNNVSNFVRQGQRERQSIRVPNVDTARSSQPSSPTAPRGNNQEDLLVVLDPGHGGKDPGAVGIGGLQEKNVVLPISDHVRQTLESNGIRVKMTRRRDRFVSLEGRAEMANRADADFFISVHANAISMKRQDVNGTETFYYSSGKGLAQAIQRSIISKINMRDRGVKKANFYVLRNSAMPAVLVEVGFVTGREDAPRLANPDFRQRMADAIADGILQYVRQTQ